MSVKVSKVTPPAPQGDLRQCVLGRIVATDQLAAPQRDSTAQAHAIQPPRPVWPDSSGVLIGNSSYSHTQHSVGCHCSLCSAHVRRGIGGSFKTVGTAVVLLLIVIFAFATLGVVVICKPVQD